MTIDRNLVRQRYGSLLGEYAVYFRSIANEVNRDPDEIFSHLDHPAVQSLNQLRTLDAAEFFSLYEALTYGDIGVLFASPRTCLSGILLQFIGSAEQQDYYFSHLKNNAVRSFFATTEPKHGSDANQLETQFKPTGDNETLAITGEKLLVGNLGFATIGVIIGRTSKGPLGLNAALLTPEDFSNNLGKVDRRTLPMFGIKPAMLGEASFNEFEFPKSQLLGQHLNAMQRGLQAVIKTFNVMRLGITGLATGHAQALVDYISKSKQNFSFIEQQQLATWQAQITGIRQLALKAAADNQKDRINTAKISLVKVQASQLVEEIANSAINFYGSEFLIEHPYLVKSMQDCFGYEYMDGTSNIQRKNIYQGFVNAKL
jgi:alkylation response protein AidB-like acyl-CoA dehydrogenase